MQNDQDVWLKIKKDDEVAFRQLFYQYYSQLCSISNRLVQNKDAAQDIAQDAFVELWNRRKTLDINFSIYAYLKRTTINKSLNFIKAQKKILALDRHNQIGSQVTSVSQDHMERQEIIKIVRQKIKSLPDRCQEIFVLRRYEEMSYKEIAEMLSISERTVEVQLRKARMLLKEQLKPYLDYLTTLFLIFLGSG